MICKSWCLLIRFFLFDRKIHFESYSTRIMNNSLDIDVKLFFWLLIVLLLFICLFVSIYFSHLFVLFICCCLSAIAISCIRLHVKTMAPCYCQRADYHAWKKGRVWNPLIVLYFIIDDISYSARKRPVALHCSFNLSSLT